MGFRANGDNIEVPGQAVVTLRPSSLDHVTRVRDVNKYRAWVTSLNLNAAAPIDLTVIAIPAEVTKWIPTRAVVYNPTANLSAANLGLYTAAGAGGTNIVAPVALANLTGATTKFQVLAIAAITDHLIVNTIYPRLTVASGVAGSASLFIEFEDIGLI